MRAKTITKSVVRVRCYDQQGRLKWEEVRPNLTTDEGRTEMLNRTFVTSVTPAWYMGLIDQASYTAIDVTDTAAKIVASTGTPNPPTTNGWKEFVGYSETARPTINWGTPANASVDNTASPVTFSFNTSGTLKGVFSITDSTKDGTVGKIYSEVLFSADRPVSNGETLTVEITHTLSSV